jgi:hypothetical protein
VGKCSKINKKFPNKKFSVKKPRWKLTDNQRAIKHE